MGEPGVSIMGGAKGKDGRIGKNPDFRLNLDGCRIYTIWGQGKAGLTGGKSRRVIYIYAHSSSKTYSRFDLRRYHNAGSFAQAE